MVIHKENMMTKFKWTEQSESYLREQWMNKRAVDLAADLGVSKYAIMHRVRKLGLPKKPIGRPQDQYYQWTESMDQYLKDNFKQCSNAELSQHLSVSIQALMRRMKKLDLSRGKDGFKHFKWQEHDERRLVALFEDGIMIHEIAEAFGVSKQTIKRKLKALDLSRTELRRGLM